MKNNEINRRVPQDQDIGKTTDPVHQQPLPTSTKKKKKEARASVPKSSMAEE